MGYIENGIVAMFDILGFASLIKNENMEDIIGYINNGFADVVESNTWGVKSTDTITYVNGNKVGDVIAPDKENVVVNYRYYFDTLIYFTNDTSEKSFYRMMIISAKVLAQMYFYIGLPIRGAISCGELYCDENNIFGKAIIDAHEYEQKQEWAGVTLSEKLIEEFHGSNVFKHMYKDNVLLNYEIPMKKEPMFGYTLNWMQYNGEKWDINRFEHQWQSLRKDKSMDSSVKQKLENTKIFRKNTINVKIKNKQQYNFGRQIMI